MRGLLFDRQLACRLHILNVEYIIRSLSAETYGGQGANEAVGVGSVNSNNGVRKGSAAALLRFVAIAHARAVGSVLRPVLICLGVLPVPVGVRGLAQSYNVERGTE